MLSAYHGLGGSHSAKHRKMAGDPQGAKTPEPILMKLGMVDYVRTPPHMTTLVGVAQRGWSGQIFDLSHLGVSFLFFLFLDRSRQSTPKRIFPVKDVPFGGLDNIRLQTCKLSKKHSPK